MTAAEFQALPITPDAFHGDWNDTLAPVPPRPQKTPATARRIDPDLTTMLSDPALTGMPRSDFERLVAASEPYWDALAEAAFQRRSTVRAVTFTGRPAAWTTTTVSWQHSYDDAGRSPAPSWPSC